MKKFKYVCLAALVSLSAVIGSACSGGGSAASSVLLNYGTGLGDTKNYNSDLYAFNQRDTVLADTSAIYVPADRVHKDGKTYAGYWMYGTGGSRGAELPTTYDESVVGLEVPCFYSDDLSTWKNAGSEATGYCLIGKEDDWEAWGDVEGSDVPWAAEVIYDETEQKYYMFYNTTAKKREIGEIATESNTAWDRLYIGIAVSDYPCGPFYTLSKTDELTGEKVPCVNFKKYFGLDYDYAVIDISPFIDVNGDKYLYFTKHPNYEGADYAKKPAGSMVMKMNSWTEPDYETLKYVLLPDYMTVESLSGSELVHAPIDGKYPEGSGKPDCNPFGVKGVGITEMAEGGVNEGPFVLERNGKYYITYSGQGYKSHAYTVYQAVADSPMGPFTKIEIDKGNPVLSGSDTHYVKGTGHHSFVSDGKELFIVYHIHCNTIDYSSGWSRMAYSDRVNWVKNADGVEVLTSNGPSECLQWLPESTSGYKNLTPQAKITTNTGSGAAYLADGVLPFYNFNSGWVFSSTGKDVTITLTFPEAVTVRSIMVYNAYAIEQAFSEIAEVRFELAEKPDWASKEYTYALIQNLKFPDLYVNMTNETLVNCAPAVAEFNEIKVKSISLDIKKNARIYEYDKFGNANTELNITEIVVLGR